MWENGVYSYNPPNGHGTGKDIIVEHDGSIIIAGWFDDNHSSFGSILRLLDPSLTGSYDSIQKSRWGYRPGQSPSSFNGDGRQLAISPLGTVYGFGGHVLGRLSSNSAAFQSIQNFGTVGADGPRIRGDERIFIPRLNKITALNSDLSSFWGFGQGGSTAHLFNEETIYNSIGFHPDGRLIACGHRVINGTEKGFVARLTLDGELDSSYGENGITDINFGNSNSAVRTLVRGDGSALIIGNSDTLGFVAKYDDAGILDQAFGSNGFFIPGPFPNDPIIQISEMLVQPDNKIVLGGNLVFSSHVKYMFIRLHSNGVLDQSFGENGISILPNLSDDPQDYDRISGMDFLSDYQIVFGIDSYWVYMLGVLKNDVNVGIRENQPEIDWSVFPNPISKEEELQIRLTKTNYHKWLSIFDVSGELILVKRLRTSTSSVETINLQELKPGLYIIRLNGENKTDFKKLVVY